MSTTTPQSAIPTHVLKIEDDRKLIEYLLDMKLECHGVDRRFLIGRDTLVRLQKLRDINGQFIVNREWTTLLGLPVDIDQRPGFSECIGITCDAP